MKSQTWRDHAKEVLKEVFANLPKEATVKQARKAVKDAYPFCQRSMHPYKIWCDESRKWLEQRFPELRRERLRKEIAKRGETSVAQLSTLRLPDLEYNDD